MSPAWRRGALLGLLLLCWVGRAQSATYYVNPQSGLDANPGSIGSPWKTLHKVKTTVGPGDTVYIRGGTYTPSQYQGEAGIPAWTQSQAAGTANNPITLTNYPGETVIFDGQAQQYWMRWIVTAATGHRSFYVVVRGLQFRRYTTVVFSVNGFNATNRARHVTVQDNTVSDLYDGTSGDMVTKYAQYVIWKNNRTVNVGDTSRSYDGYKDHATYISEHSYNIVHDGNYFEKISGYGYHGWFNHGSRDPGENLIVRRNTIVNAQSALMIFGGCVCTNVYVYNNTLYGEPVPFPQVSAGPASAGITNRIGSPLWTHFRIFNNIGWLYTSSAPLQLFATGNITDMQLDYNLWVNATTPSQVYQYGTAADTGPYYTLAAFQAATTYEDHSKNQDPLFTTPSAPTRNFTLQPSSPAVNAGRILTTAVGAGSGTTLVVEDAGYFHDGFGMIEGDTIQIGTQAPVVVTAVNYTTNTLTLAAARTWTAGLAVSLPYNGSAPDMGASESGQTAPDVSAQLVAHWTFDENAGTTAADQTGRGHPATLAGGATWAAGLQGSAVALAGGSETVTVPDHADFTLSTGFSLVAAIYLTATPSTEVKILGQWDDLTQNNGAWELLLDGLGKLTIKIRTAGGNSVCTDPVTTFALNTWYQVAGTYDGGTSGSNCALYVDGTQTFTGTLTNVPFDSAVPVGIGMVTNTGAGRTWVGRLDNVRIYGGRALTPAEIAQLVVTTTPPDPPQPPAQATRPGSRPLSTGLLALP